jgi:hypothetical protein
MTFPSAFLLWNNYGNEGANPVTDEEIGDWNRKVVRYAAKE